MPDSTDAPTGFDAQRVVLHVGLPKTGTMYLQALLAQSREQLRGAGVLYPNIGPGAMFRGAIEVRCSHAEFGFSAEEVAGSWQSLGDRARSFPGSTAISHEVLAGATLAQIADALAPLAGLEVQVVVTARDLGRQATAHWQEEVKLGDTRSFADFEREQFRADTGRDAGPDAGGCRPRFWHAQDFADAVSRWSSVVPAERVHLVVCPAPGADPGELWRRFADAAGMEAGLIDPVGARNANPSLGSAQIALLREINVALAGRLNAAAYLRIVKRGYAEEVLAAHPTTQARTPYELGRVFEPVTTAWLAEVSAAGHPVHGSLHELMPVLGECTDPHPDVVPDEERLLDDPVALADRFVAEQDRVAPVMRPGIVRRLGSLLPGSRRA